MSSPSKILEHYPVERLPPDIQQLVPNARRVTIELTAEDDASPPTDTVPKYLRFWGAAAHKGTGADEAVARIRKLRDEWD